MQVVEVVKCIVMLATVNVEVTVMLVKLVLLCQKHRPRLTSSWVPT